MVEPVAVVPEAESHRHEPHQRAIARSPWIGRTGEGLASVEVALKRIPSRDPDVEAVPGARVFSVPPSCHESVHQIVAVKVARRQRALRDGQRHCRVVSPATRLKLERPAAFDVNEPSPFVTRPEFQRRSESR